MKKKSFGFILKIILLAMAAAISVKLVDQQIKIRDAETKYNELVEKYEYQQLVNGELRSIVNNGINEEYIAALAREKLGYMFPNGVLFIDTSSK